MKKGLMVTGIAVVTMVVFGAYAFADAGWGRGITTGPTVTVWGAEDCPGYGRTGKGRYGKGASALSEEDAAKVNMEREAFFKDTKDLRQSIQQKRLEMSAEMAKKAPDAGKLADLQKEVSSLKADFDQKRLDHRLAMKKLLPDFQAGSGMGSGYGHRRGSANGGCWRQ